MTRILVVDDSSFNLKIISASLAPLGFEIHTAANGREALDRVAAIQPDLIILDVMMPGINGYEVCRLLRRMPSAMHRPIMMLTANDSLDERVQGFEAGADDYMRKPFDAPELQARVKALLRRFEPAKAVPVAAQAPGKVIAVFSLRGGIGVSTLATNLAVGLAQIWGQPSALVDLALTCGQSALMLNLPLRHSWADLARAEVAEIDAQLIDAVLLKHASGVRVLATPSRPEERELITPEKVGQTIRTLQQQYPYVILDLPHDFSETTLAALDASQQILAVLAPDLAAVRATVSALEVFSQLDYERSAVALVLNHPFERGGLGRAEIETALKHPIAMTLPYAADLLVSAINRGVPPVAEQPARPISMAFEDHSFFLSAEAQRSRRPDQPTAAWQRVAQRAQQRRRAS